MNTAMESEGDGHYYLRHVEPALVQGSYGRVAEMAPGPEQRGIPCTLKKEYSLCMLQAVVCPIMKTIRPETGAKYNSKKNLSLPQGGPAGYRKRCSLPINQDDGGCDCAIECKHGTPGTSN